jgi:hypothetical protein
MSIAEKRVYEVSKTLALDPRRKDVVSGSVLDFNHVPCDFPVKIIGAADLSFDKNVRKNAMLNPKIFELTRLFPVWEQYGFIHPIEGTELKISDISMVFIKGHNQINGTKALLDSFISSHPFLFHPRADQLRHFPTTQAEVSDFIQTTGARRDLKHVSDVHRPPLTHYYAPVSATSPPSGPQPLFRPRIYDPADD